MTSANVEAPPLVPGRYFHPREAACHDGTPFPVEWVSEWERSRDLADVARELWGGPLIAQSWYRTDLYNEGLKQRSDAAGRHQVVSGSIHEMGLAIDIKTSKNIERARADVPHLHRVIMLAYEDNRIVLGKRVRELLGGIGPYPVSGWVHVDGQKAPDGHLRRWTGR